MALYFIRHGESESNERNLFAGRFDTPLTKLGRLQAEQARQIVARKNLQFDEVHFSSLSRAKDTARIVASESASKATFVENDALIERDFGLLSEQNKSLIKKYFGAAKFEHMFHSPDGSPPRGESFHAMYERVKNYYETELRPKDREQKNILIVAHKYIIEMFVLIAADLTPTDYHDFRVPNCKPLTFNELKRCVTTTSPLVNRFSEEIEARLSPVLVIATFAGAALRLFLPNAFQPTLFTVLMLSLLAVNSGFSLLRFNEEVFQKSFSCLKRVWKGLLLRALTGLTILAFAKTTSLVAVGTFLLLPAAMTAPTLSLMWGGDYFLSFQTTLVTLVLSPVVLYLGAQVADPHLFSAAMLPSFLIALFVSVILPGIGAQLMRRARPIQAGALSTNWGWIGGGILIPLAFLMAFQFAPSFAELGHLKLLPTLRDVFLIASLFALVRLFGGISARIGVRNERANLDRFITHIAPNIFFWFTLLPSAMQANEVRLLTSVFFFLSIYLEEKRIVSQFPLRIGLTPERRRWSRAGGHATLDVQTL